MLLAGLGLMLAGRLHAQTLTIVHSFSPTLLTFPPSNDDGAGPQGLILSFNCLYGTAKLGGESGRGAVFKLNTDGSGFATLHSFSPNASDLDPSNSDGALPFGGLVISSNMVYGTAYSGGSGANGTVFTEGLLLWRVLCRSGRIHPASPTEYTGCSPV